MESSNKIDLVARVKELELKNSDLVSRSKAKIDDLISRLSEYELSEKNIELYKSMFQAKKEITASKNGHVRGNFSYKYFTFSDIYKAIDSALSNNGLLCIQGPKDGNIMETRIIHAETGQKIIFRCKIVPSSNQDTNKAIGAGFTYAKKYSLLSIFGIVDSES